MRYRRLVRPVFAALLIAFTIINFNFYLTQRKVDTSPEGEPSGHSKGNPLPWDSPSTKFGYSAAVKNGSGHLPFLRYSNISDIKNKTLDTLNIFQPGIYNLSSLLNGTDRFNLDMYTPLGDDSELIQKYIAQANHQQHIRNLDRFDLSSSPSSVVIIIQVSL